MSNIFRFNDFRAEYLNQQITGLDNSIQTLKRKVKEINWYDGVFLLEDLEPIFGLAFVAFQIYVNGSIKDVFGNTVNKWQYYSIEPLSNDFERSRVELIIGLANYAKHKDDGSVLHKGTKEILESFKLRLGDDVEIENSPIFEGLTILNENWDLFEVMNVVKTWREKLWLEQG
jgi:hypothetical protein